MQQDNEDDDPVVEEIPVFLSKTLINNLMLLQYPNKSSSSNVDSDAVVNSLFKPINEEVKLDLALETNSRNFDRFKAEQFAIASDGKSRNKSERPNYRNGVMDKQSLTSTKSIDDPNKYAIGIFQDNELHLTPIKNVLQLRPSFSYFDKEDKRTKAEQKAIDGMDEDEQEEVKQVDVKFSRIDLEKLNKAREKSYEYMMEKSKEEPWCEAMWHKSDSSAVELERQKLFANRNETHEHAFNLNSEEYIRKLIPPERSDENLEKLLPSRIINHEKLSTLPLKIQLQVILKDAKMLTFTEIMEILRKFDKSIVAEKVLRTLPLIGVLMRGNWVVQSEIIYPSGTVSNKNGVSSELMIRGRDYVLYKFSKQEFLLRRTVILATQLPNDEVLEILQSVARCNSNKKWELLSPPDVLFEMRYPELVQRQEMLWKARETMFNEMEYEKSFKRIRKRSTKFEHKN